MANILVYIETEGDVPVPPSLETLGEARRLATRLGASLQAFALVARADTAYGRYGHDALVRALGMGGADKVMLRVSSTPRHPPQWHTDGEALCEACQLLRPRVVLLSATSAGRSIAPRVAARLEAAFVPEATIEHGGPGEVVFARTICGHRASRRLVGGDLPRPVVLTLSPGAFQPESGWDEAETRLLEPPLDAGEPSGARVLCSHPSRAWRPSRSEPGDEDPEPGPAAAAPDLATARVVVVAGDGVTTPEAFALVAELAEALGGQVAATRSVCDRGLAPRARQIGVDARSVAPALYVVCAPGSDEHLGAVSGDAAIVAIDPDPEAPIFDVAGHGLVGAVEDVVPALIEALRARSPVAMS